MPTTIEQLELEVQSSSTSAVAGIDALSASLSKVKNAIKGGIGLTSVANQVRNLDSALKSMDSSGANKIDKLASSLDKLRGLGSLKISSSIGNQLRNIGSAATSLTGVDFSAMEKLGTALQPLNNLNASGLKSTINALNKLPKLADILDNMDMTKFTNQIQQLSTALAPLTNQLNAVTAAFSRLPTNIQRAITVTNRISQENNKATNSYMNLYAKIKMAMGVVRNGARVIASWITQSNQYIEDVNLFTASMGKYTEEAQNYAKAVSDALGIDPGEFMRNQGVFNTIISGFGVASDKAYLMSKNLTQLGYDISSFFNITFEDAMQKLQSGISGELEPLRRLGYDLSVARLQEEALALGIKKKVSAMTQAEKSQLRYYAIMTQVTTAQGDMARTLNAPANQLRILKAQVTQCARALGNIFIPMLNAVIPYAIALVKVVRMLADSIASLFGFTLPEVDYSGVSAGATAVGDLANNAEDASDGLSKAGKAAKKLKNALLGIDELNILSKDDSSSGSGSGGGDGLGAGIGGGDLGIDLPTYDFLGDAITSKVDEIVQMIKDAMWEITSVISTFLLAIGTILVVTGANLPLGIGLMAVGAVGLAASVMENWNGMSERLAKVLTLVTGVLGGFLLAIGAFLVFSGVNVPLGAGLIVAGAAALGTAVAINWKSLNGDLSNALSILTAIVSGALLAMGALFAFTGVDIPLGIALMVAGAVGMVTAIGLNWDSMSDPLRRTIGMLEAIVGGALLTFGAILALTGANVPLGVAMIAAGAISVASAVALNWNSLTGDVQDSVLSIVAIVSGALIGIGAILALTGVATGLGIGMIAAGAVGLAATVGLNWDTMPDNIKKTITKILLVVGAASIAIGMILAFTGAATPLGVGLILAGAAALGTAVALNWDTLTNKLKSVTTKVLEIVGAAALVIGIILVCTGVGIPLGIGLILSGAAALGTAVAINWETIKNKISEVFTKIKSMGGSLGKLAIGLILCLTGVGIPLGLALIADGVKDFATGKPVSWDSMVSGIKEALGNISDEWNKFKNKVKDSEPVQFLAEVKSNASEWWNGIVELFSPAIDWFSELFGSIFQTISDIFYNIGVIASGCWEIIKAVWGIASEWFSEHIITPIATFFSNMWNGIKDGAITVWNGIESVFSVVGNWFNENVIQPVAGFFTDLWDGFVKGAKKAWDGVKSVFSPVAAFFSNTFKKAWQGIVKVFSTAGEIFVDIKDGIVSAFKTVVNGIIKGLNKVVSIPFNGINAALKKIRDAEIAGWQPFSSLRTITVPQIPLLAEGGIITPKNVPKYAGGTNRVHGSMFVAGESGAELVGHVNGNTEVLNRFQMGQIMHSSIIAGMAQFLPVWKTLNNTLITSANAIIQSVLVSAEAVNSHLATQVTYDPSNILSQSVYDETERIYGKSCDESAMASVLREITTDANNEQNALLREQNNLLRRLLEKDQTVRAVITAGDVVDGLNRKNRRDGKITVPVG